MRDKPAPRWLIVVCVVLNAICAGWAAITHHLLLTVLNAGVTMWLAWPLLRRAEASL